jgi:hypothetical protein
VKLPPSAPEIFHPFKVFISSSQNEFDRLREALKERINSERFVDQRIMRSVLIEDETGPVIAEDIAREINDCSIYVGIFGRRQSDWTFREYREARARDISLLIYQLRRRGRGIPRGRRSDVQRFLDREVKERGIRIRQYGSEDRLERAVLNDLALETARLVNEAARVRKAIHGGLVP